MSQPVQSQREAVPAAWVDRIWGVMRATYGVAFDRQWACPAGIDPVQHVSAMRTHWAGNLAVFAGNPGAIAYALDNLPVAHPPNLLEFVALCRRRPDAPLPALEGPAADPARVAGAMGKAKAPRAPRHPMAWAHEVRAREARGDRVSRYAREAWRRALRLPLDAPARQGDVA